MTNSVFNAPSYWPNPLTGDPVSGGFLYVGEVDTDPEIVSNQKTVSALQEDSSIVALSQPISLSAGGVPTYDGSVVTLLVTGNYSVKVLNAQSAQVYYVPSIIELLMLSDTAFGASWNGVTDKAPSKNAVYDKIVAMISDTAYAVSWDGVTDISPSKNALYDKFEAVATAIAAAKTLVAGDIVAWGGAIADIPSNRLLCDGSAVSRTTYSGLFAAIGVIHGAGDGSTTFNLPDLTDKFIIHADADSGGTNDVADTGGTSTHLHTTGDHALTEAELASHDHVIPGTIQGGGYVLPISGTSYGGATLTTSTAGSGSAHNHGNTGSSSNRDKYYALAYTIVY